MIQRSPDAQSSSAIQSQTSIANQQSAALTLFISYKRQDSSSFAKKLYANLCVNGYKVFFDERNITGADYLNDEISSAIEKCDVMIFILSENYAYSDWCIKELKFAESKEKRKVLIKRMQGQFPSVVQFIIKDQLWINFFKDEEYEEKFYQLINALEKVCSHEIVC